MLWEVEIRPASHQIDREGERVTHEAQAMGSASIRNARSARSFLEAMQVGRGPAERLSGKYR